MRDQFRDQFNKAVGGCVLTLVCQCTDSCAGRPGQQRGRDPSRERSWQGRPNFPTPIRRRCGPADLTISITARLRRGP